MKNIKELDNKNKRISTIINQKYKYIFDERTYLETKKKLLEEYNIIINEKQQRKIK